MTGHQFTYGHGEVGSLGSSSALLSDSRYPTDRFTPVLNDWPLDNYRLVGHCAGVDVKSLPSCGVLWPWALCNSQEAWTLAGSDRKVLRPSCLSFCMGCCCLPPKVEMRSQPLMGFWSPYYSDMQSSHWCCSGPGAPGSKGWQNLSFGKIHPYWRDLFIVTH